MKDNSELEKFMLDISTNIFLELNGHGQITYASKKAAYIFHNADSRAKNIDALFDARNVSLIRKHVANVLYQNYPDTVTLDFQGRFYNLFIYPRQRHAVLCMEDITERRHLSHHLHETRQRLEFAERTAKLGYWELDLPARKFYWSGEMYRIFGVDAQNVHQKRNLIREQVISEDLPLYKSKLSELLKNGMPVEGMLRVRRRNGYIAHCLFKAGLVFDNQGEKVAGTFQDISNLIEIQNSLEDAKHQAEASNRAKSYFLAQASHDLRQPMQALQMFIELLKEEKNTLRQKQVIQKIEDSAASLKALLDNLLDISRLDSDGIIIENASFDISELLCRLCKEYQSCAELQKIKIICRLQNSIIDSDSLLWERLVRNLLSNAVKYTKDKILISCRKKQKGTLISVADNGAGISKEESKLVFEEFYQSKNIENNRSRGAGLGLSIVQKIARLLGADIKLRSSPGKYTVFSVFLPDKN